MFNIVNKSHFNLCKLNCLVNFVTYDFLTSDKFFRERVDFNNMQQKCNNISEFDVI